MIILKSSNIIILKPYPITTYVIIIQLKLTFYNFKCTIKYSLPSIFNFSTPSKWNKLDEHLQLFGKVIKPIAGNGYCFVESVRVVMNHNQQKKIGFPELKDKILDEMYDNVEFYANFHAFSAKVF